MGELLGRMVISTEATVNGWADSLAAHLPSNPAVAGAIVVAALIVGLLLGGRVAHWTFGKPIEWCKQGRPLLPTQCESRETFPA